MWLIVALVNLVGLILNSVGGVDEGEGLLCSWMPGDIRVCRLTVDYLIFIIPCFSCVPLYLNICYQTWRAFRGLHPVHVVHPALAGQSNALPLRRRKRAREGAFLTVPMSLRNMFVTIFPGLLYYLASAYGLFTNVIVQDMSWSWRRFLALLCAVIDPLLVLTTITVYREAFLSCCCTHKRIHLR